jgi:hypothetical protein
MGLLRLLLVGFIILSLLVSCAILVNFLLQLFRRRSPQRRPHTRNAEPIEIVVTPIKDDPPKR